MIVAMVCSWREVDGRVGLRIWFNFKRALGLLQMFFIAVLLLRELFQFVPIHLFYSTSLKNGPLLFVPLYIAC